MNTSNPSSSLHGWNDALKYLAHCPRGMPGTPGKIACGRSRSDYGK
ncbi:hypothetical protein [Agathobaculum sp. TL06]